MRDNDKGAAGGLKRFSNKKLNDMPELQTNHVETRNYDALRQAFDVLSNELDQFKEEIKGQKELQGDMWAILARV